MIRPRLSALALMAICAGMVTMTTPPPPNGFAPSSPPSFSDWVLLDSGKTTNDGGGTKFSFSLTGISALTTIRKLWVYLPNYPLKNPPLFTDAVVDLLPLHDSLFLKSGCDSNDCRVYPWTFLNVVQIPPELVQKTMTKIRGIKNNGQWLAIEYLDPQSGTCGQRPLGRSFERPIGVSKKTPIDYSFLYLYFYYFYYLR